LTDVNALDRIVGAVREGPNHLPNTCLYRLNGDEDYASRITTSTIRWDGEAMAIASVDSVVRVWDLKGVSVPPSRSPVQPGCADRDDCVRLVGHAGPVYDVGFVPGNSKYLLSCSEDTSMRLWDITAGTHSSNLVVYQGHTYPVWCLAVDRLGLNIVTGTSMLCNGDLVSLHLRRLRRRFRFVGLYASKCSFNSPRYCCLSKSYAGQATDL
jgi:WD40 repeat protein